MAGDPSGKGGGLLAGWPGVKDLCSTLETQGTQFVLPGYPTGKTGDRGDRTEFYVLKFYQKGRDLTLLAFSLLIW